VNANTMIKDPICGMTVDEATALRAERGGETFNFCGEHCREKFLAQTAPAEAAGECRGGRTKDSDHGHSPHQHGKADVKPSSAAKYYCPMCPGVESDQPGDCPKCGMALESNPAWAAPPTGKPIYTCPMHPEVQQDHPGNCPKCGMALELKTVTATPSEEENAELTDMTRRLWMGGALALPVFLLAMAHLIPPLRHEDWVMGDASRWTQFALATPVVLWAGRPFFKRGWRSVVNRSLNMFTLIAIGVGAA
jgi:P-type Cu+ transporter